MKLRSNRDKDRVHVRGKDSAGLFNKAVEYGSSEDLRSWLRHIRETGRLAGPDWKRYAAPLTSAK